MTELAGASPPPRLPVRALRPTALLGDGAFGCVWRAAPAAELPPRDWPAGVPLHATLAVKQLSQAWLLDGRQAHRAVREVRALARLSGHPGIVPLAGVDADAEYVYTIMPAAQGGTLAGLIAAAAPSAPSVAAGACSRSSSGGLPVAVARFYAAGVLDALAHCHAAGVAYRDVKADNVLVRSGREPWWGGESAHGSRGDSAHGSSGDSAHGSRGDSAHGSGGEAVGGQPPFAGYPVLCDFMFALGGHAGTFDSRPAARTGATPPDAQRAAAVGCGCCAAAATPAAVAAVLDGQARTCFTGAITRGDRHPRRFHDLNASALHAALLHAADAARAGAGDAAGAAAPPPSHVGGADAGCGATSSDGPPIGARCRASSLLGTPSHMPPEMARAGSTADDVDGGDGGGYDALACDVWSLGVLVFHMLTGRLPWGEGGWPGGGGGGTAAGPPPLDFDADFQRQHPQAVDFVAACLRPVPAARPTVRQLQHAHPWMAGVEWGELRAGRLPCPATAAGGHVSAADGSAHGAAAPLPAQFGPATDLHHPQRDAHAHQPPATCGSAVTDGDGHAEERGAGVAGGAAAPPLQPRAHEMLCCELQAPVFLEFLPR